MQNGKYKTEAGYQPRKKLHSLRSLVSTSPIQTSHDLPASTLTLQKRSFDQLERSLNRDNHLEEQPVAEPAAVIPGFEEEAIEGRLWEYFWGRVEAVGGKVEKEQVNCREKHFWVVKQQVTHLQSTYSRQIAQLENVIKEKYKQVHGLFEEIKQERSLKVFSLSPKPKKNKKEALMLDNTERLIGLKEHVQLIRNDVLGLELQLGKITQDADKLKREWVTFLKCVLKGGHYLKDGMGTVLQEMMAADYTPTTEDMPDVLDESSKKCLLQEYHYLRTKAKKTNRVPPLQLERSRILSEARQSLSEIARKNLVREVYKDTQEFMANLVKQSDWRTTNITLPKIPSSRQESG